MEPRSVTVYGTKIKALNGLLPFVSGSRKRYALEGIAFDFANQVMVATNGNIIGITRFPDVEDVQQGAVDGSWNKTLWVIPSDHIANLVKAMKTKGVRVADHTANITFTENSDIFEISIVNNAGATVGTQTELCATGSFPEYKPLAHERTFYNVTLPFSILDELVRATKASVGSDARVDFYFSKIDDNSMSLDYAAQAFIYDDDDDYTTDKPEVLFVPNEALDKYPRNSVFGNVVVNGIRQAHGDPVLPDTTE